MTKISPMEKYDGQQPVAIEALDADRCQGEVIERLGAFRLGGPPTKVVRCSNAPYFVAVENQESKKDRLRGAMTLCLSCAEIMTKKYLPAGGVSLYVLMRSKSK